MLICTPSLIDRELNLGKAGLIRIMSDRKTELATHGQHCVVLVEDDAFDAANSFGTRVTNDVLKQRPAEAMTLQVGSDDERIFGNPAIRVGGEPTDTSERSRL